MKSLPSLSSNPKKKLQSQPADGKTKKFNLKIKATILGMAIGVLPVILIGKVTYLFADRAFDRQIKQFKELQAISMIDKAEQFVLERYNNIRLLSNLFIFRDRQVRKLIDPELQSKKLTEYLKIHGVYDSIAFIDLKGRNIVTSEGETLVNHKEKDYFQAVLDRKRRFISQPRQDPVTGKTVIYFSAPVRDSQSNALVGVVVSRMPVEHLKKLLEEYGVNGSTYHLIDKSGRIFVTNNLKALGTKAYQHSARFARLRQEKRSNFVKIYEKVEKRRVLGGYAAFKTTKATTNLGWDGFLVTDIKVAYADLERLGFTIVMGTFVIAIVTGTISAIIANRTLKPIAE